MPYRLAGRLTARLAAAIVGGVGALYTGSFELRRLVVRFSRTPAGGVTEDQVMFTLHLAKLTSGAPDSNWLTADYTAVEGRFDTWWTTMKPNFMAWQSLASYVWYKDGPAWSPIDRGNGPPNPAVRTTARAVVGTTTIATAVPPQAAATITKVCDVRKRWGRVYLPGVTAGNLTNEGRWTDTFTNLLVSAMVTCLNGCRTDGKQPVVWSRARSAYTSPKGSVIPAHDASAYEITSVIADNLPDVQRSRRFSTPTKRTQTALT